MGRRPNERRVADIVDDYVEEVLANQENETRANPEPWMQIWMDMERMKDPE